LEETVCAFVRDACARAGSGPIRLCVSGGVFANVRLNQEVAQLPEVSELFVHPHMGDGGLGAGSALALHARMHPASSLPSRMAHAYLGPSLNDADIRATLERRGLPFRRVDAPEQEAARLLSEGRCVVWTSGAMEYGPRALCHRSILYQAVDPTVN